MIKEIDGYKDGGTISLKLSYTGFLLSKFKDDPIVKEALDKYNEICIDCRMGTNTLGKMTIGYPDKSDAIEITDEKIVEYILNEVKKHIMYKENYFKKAKKGVQHYWRRKFFLEN